MLDDAFEVGGRRAQYPFLVIQIVPHMDRLGTVDKGHLGAEETDRLKGEEQNCRCVFIRNFLTILCHSH